jgi:hypothetical protein
MTKTSERFANSVASLIAGVQVISDQIVLTPTRHIFRGLSFERTPAKNYYYLWKLVVPLFSPIMENLSLNYSERIDITGASGPIFIGGECAELVHDVVKAFHSIVEDRIARDREVQKFLRFANEMGEIRSNMMLETAIGYGIIGDFDEARRRLHKILSLKSASPILPQVQETARQIVMAIDSRNESFAHLVQMWERRNIHTHFPGLLTLRSIPL